MKHLGELALIALGSNQESSWGDPTETVKKAMLAIEKLTQTPVEKSRLYKTPPFPADAGPSFVNAAVAVRTKLAAPNMLQALHQIEAEAGRQRHGRWRQRTLDLDLIAWGDLVWPDAQTQTDWRNLSLIDQQNRAPDGLVLPHPRLQDRSFVLVPLADVAPHWQHPLLGTTVREMLSACHADDIASVVAIP